MRPDCRTAYVGKITKLRAEASPFGLPFARRWAYETRAISRELTVTRSQKAPFPSLKHS